MTPRDTIDQAGGIQAVAERFAKKQAYVKRLQYGKVLPASWYVALCDMTGDDLPYSLFSFKAMEE